MLEKKEFNENKLDNVQNDKRIYDLEQMLDIAKSFCSNLDLSNLLESIVYICMAQMHVLGAEIFVRDLLTNEEFVLETGDNLNKVSISVSSKFIKHLMKEKKPLLFSEIKQNISDCPDLDIISKFNPTLVVPLIQTNHLNGILILQERIAIEDNNDYNEYEKSQIMSIASLASVAINNAALLEKSSTDMMTHLKLKYYFFNILSQEIDNAFLTNENLAVLMFDIDFFKKFNDTYGHECGDYVLISVANIIKQALRENDIASRYGGEEFTVMLNKTGKNDAVSVAERIRSKIDEYDFVFNEKHLHVTISGGVSVFDARTNLVNSPNEFVNQADKALYVSKNTGRNKISYFDPLKQAR